MKENVIKMARPKPNIIYGGTMNKEQQIEELTNKITDVNCFYITDEDIGYSDRYSMSKKIAEHLYEAGYRKQRDTVKEFAEKVKFGMAQFGYYFCGINGVEYFGDIQVNDFTKMINNLAGQFGKEEK